MNYQSVYTIQAPGGSQGTPTVWSLDGQMVPNPLSFGWANAIAGNATENTEFLNSQMSGATHGQRLAQFLGDFQRWRLAYASVTIYQDGPDLANQGTVVVCQKPVDPMRFNISQSGLNAENAGVGLMHAFHLEEHDLPNYLSSQGMPNAYFGRSREGVYIPLKLTKTHQQWRSHRDLTYQATSASFTGFNSPGSPIRGGQLTLAGTTAAVISGQIPFLSINDLHRYVNEDPPPGPYVQLAGETTSDFCNENWADFSFRNMAMSTSLSFFFRYGFEVQVQPTSIMAPHLKLSPPHDAQAIDTYFAISRELKDGYPADFNDLGKIWDKISSIAKTLAPALSMLPVVGPLMPSAINGVTAVGDRIREAFRSTASPTIGSTMSMADKQVVEAVREAMPAPTVSANEIAKARKKIAKTKKMKKRGSR